MKISSSISTSTSTSTSSPPPFDLNSDDAAAGCFSGVLRRLVCGNLSIRTSGRSSEEANVVDTDISGGGGEKTEQEKPAAPPPPAPSIVARLMGLESMPVHHCTPHGPIGRSRSTGSLDGWPVFFPAQIRPSHSFREIPTFLRRENEEFLLLSFGADDGEEDLRSESEGTKGEVGCRELEEEKKRKENKREKMTEKKKKRNEQRVCCREKMSERSRRGAVAPQKKEVHIKPRVGSTAEKAKEMPERAKIVKKRQKKKRSSCSEKRAEPECGTQNSSPVSVLDCLPDLDSEYLVEPSTSISEEESKPAQLSSRTKLSSELDNLSNPSPTGQVILIPKKGELRSIEQESFETGEADSAPPSCSELWGEICRLVEEDVKKSNWVSGETRKMEDFEEIMVGFGMQILDALFYEALEEFFHLPSAL